MKRFDKSDIKAITLVMLGIAIMVLIGFNEILQGVSVFASVFR